MNTAKSFDISKHIVWEAYLCVKRNKGAEGVDDICIAGFEENLKDNLYALWNRMSSGTYFPPPVRMVEIPKKDRGKRQLGIPTVADRIAQMVAKIYLEPKLEPLFHEDSYGYRPNKSAHDAIGKARERCWKYQWVIDLDIQAFFDNLDHNLLMRAIRKHIPCKWLLLYIERWLKASIKSADGQIQERVKGTPQGGVISPLLANLFLHYAFDAWMQRAYKNNPYERYADDIIVHCKTEAEASALKVAIERRLENCKLRLHPNKTQIVYCRSGNQVKEYANRHFDFLGYTFRPRMVKSKEGRFFTSFSPAISKKASNAIRQSMREWKLQSQPYKSINDMANWINPKLRGWYNYYGKYHKTAMYPIFSLLNLKLAKWARGKYKKLKGHPTRAGHWLGKIAKRESNLFVHWQLGIRPSTGQ